MIKHYGVSLRNRVALSLAVFAVSIAIIVVSLGDIINEKLEESVWRSTLEAELSFYLQARQANPELMPPNTADLTTYVWHKDTAKPVAMAPQIAELTPGIYDEISMNGGEYCVLVRDMGDDRIYIRYDITRLEQIESKFVLIASVLAALLLLIIIVISYLMAQRLVKSVHQLAQRVATLDPSVRGTQIGMAFKEQEVAVIADAINRYLRRMDGFMENEKEFIDSASHELRTPIAIISGAADVMLARADFPAAAKPALQRLYQAARQMNEIVTSLFYLAKDTAYLESLSEPIQLDERIRHIEAENRELTLQKQIEVHLQLEETFINAPAGIVTIVLSNVLRNAIVHTEQGRVSVELHGGVLRVMNTSNTITPEESVSIFMKHVRGSGTTYREGTGMGLYILKRICERMAWPLEIRSNPEQGTVVQLDFAAHVV